jgi:predicted HTH transcriptional regulator
MEGWQYIFVFFVILMAVRIIPRFIRQRKMNLQNNPVASERPLLNDPRDQPFVKESTERQYPETKPETQDMRVLRQINQGYKTFDEIRKNTGIDSDELNSILGDLEKQGLMRVEKKKGLLGFKVELLPTEKGYREYDS